MELLNLRINHMDNSLGIDFNPYFSWEIQSDENNVIQTAFRVKVMLNGNTVWDTGKTNGDQSAYVEYSGPALLNRTRYQWQVTVWDNHNNQAESTAYFETALPDKSEWKAQWVEAPFSKGRRKPGFGKQPPSTMFRKEFRLEKQVMRARLYATCHGIYRVTINGRRLDTREFAPEHTVYGKYLCYQTYDAAGALLPGGNAIGIYVGDGWFCGPNTKPDMKNFKPAHAVLFQIEVEYTDGTTMRVISDDAVKCTTGPVLSSDLFAGELYDSNLVKKNWDRHGYDDSSWQKIRTAAYGYDNLRAQLGEPVSVIQKLPVKEITTSPKGETILDFGQVIAGRLCITVNEPQGTRITLDHFEVTDKEGNYFNNIINSAVGKGCDQRDVYISDGTPATYEPLFTYHGFRYVRVTGVSGIRAENFTALVLSSEKKNAGTFECSNPKLNRLYENTRWSQRANMLSIPTDCPQREKAGWTGDIQIYAATSLLNEDTTTFLTRWLENLACDQKENGAVPYVVPNVGFYVSLFKIMGLTNKGMPSSAGWGDAAVIVPYSMYQITGNTAILKQQYSSMKKWCDYVINAAKKGRAKNKNIPKETDQYLWNTGFHYGEWLIPSMSKNGVSKETYVSMKTTKEYTAPIFGYNSIACMAAIAKTLGYEDDYQYYSDISAKMAAAFRAGVIRSDGSMPLELMGAYVLPIYFSLVPEKYKKHFADRLIDLIETNENRLDTGFLGTPFLLDALCKIGRQDKAYELLYQENCPSWLFAVNHGATTIWESWYAYNEDDSPIPISLNHYAFGCVDDWMFRNITGIDKLDAGFKKILIQPKPDDSLQYARRTYNSVYGVISSEWKRVDGMFCLNVTIPCNTSATVVLPNGDTYEIGSGKYEFHCTMEVNDL